MTEILDRLEPNGMKTIARYDLSPCSNSRTWNASDKRLLRKFLLSCFRKRMIQDNARAETEDVHDRKFAIHEGEGGGIMISMTRRIRSNSMWRGFWRMNAREVEATSA